MEIKTGFVLDDFEVGERVYLKGHNPSLRSMTIPYFGTVTSLNRDASTPHVKCKLDVGDSVDVTFPAAPGLIGKVLPLKSVVTGDTISRLDIRGNRLCYDVIDHVPDEKMVLELNEGSPLLDGKKPLLIILRDYSTASLEDEFMDWELEA